MNKIILIFILVTSFTYGQNQKINKDNPGTTKTDDYLEEDWRETIGILVRYMLLIINIKRLYFISKNQ